MGVMSCSSKKRKPKAIDAHGVTGFIMRDLLGNGRPTFRVYDKKNKRKFKDYDITAEEVEVKIVTHWNAFRGENLDWSDRALGTKLEDLKGCPGGKVTSLKIARSPYVKITKDSIIVYSRKRPKKRKKK